MQKLPMVFDKSLRVSRSNISHRSNEIPSLTQPLLTRSEGKAKAVQRMMSVYQRKTGGCSSCSGAK